MGIPLLLEISNGQDGGNRDTKLSVSYKEVDRSSKPSDQRQFHNYHVHWIRRSIKHERWKPSPVCFIQESSCKLMSLQ